MSNNTPAADAASLHDLIMNLRTPDASVIAAAYEGHNEVYSYKCGHRDARHAAAELATARESALVAERDALRAVFDLAVAYCHASDMAATTADLMEKSDFDPEMIEASTKADEACQTAEVELFEACRALAAPAVEGE